VSTDLACEWRQFRLLAHDRVRAMLDAALFSRDIDPVQFALWVGALVTAIPFAFAVQQTLTYATLRAAPPETVELVLFTDRLFFVVYSMLVGALVAALTWEALFPAAEDLDVIDVLPVRPRTVAAAYLASAVLAGASFCAATALPAAFVFALIAGLQSSVVAVPRSLVAHAVATAAAGTCVLLALLTVRGAVAVVGGPRLSLRLGTILQLMTIVALAAVLFFLPGILGVLAPAMLRDGTAPLIAAPALWFTGLFSAIAGPARGFLTTEGLTGLLALLALAIVVVPVYLAPAAIVRRRALEVRETARANRWTMTARVLAACALRSPASRAIFVFATISLSRSQRHGLILATHLGLGVAIVLVTIAATIVRHGTSLARPSVPLLALPLIVMFVFVLGLRAAFAVPTTVEANWLFRLADPGTRPATNATRACLLLYGVAPPVVIALFAGWAIGWPLGVGVRLAALQAASGLLLVQFALARWEKVPFTSAHAADPDTIRSRLIVGLALLIMFAFGGAALQTAALTSETMMAWYVATACGAAGVAYVARRRLEHRIPLQFDLEVSDRQTLNLSEAAR
jgi:hypothetical protein